MRLSTTEDPYDNVRRVAERFGEHEVDAIELADAVVSANHPGNAASARFIDAAISYDANDPATHAELEAASSAYERAWGLPPMRAVTPEEYDRMMRDQGHW